jgi:hypothetical protein
MLESTDLEQMIRLAIIRVSTHGFAIHHAVYICLLRFSKMTLSVTIRTVTYLVQEAIVLRGLRVFALRRRLLCPLSSPGLLRRLRAYIRLPYRCTRR